MFLPVFTVCFWLDSVTATDLHHAEMIIAELSDGQREILSVMDQYYYGLVDEENNFWQSVPGSMTVGAMIALLSLAFIVCIGCCWLRCKWASIFCVPLQTAQSNSLFLEQSFRTSRLGSSTVAVNSIAAVYSDAPPQYPDPPSYSDIASSHTDLIV